jgi:hypothetical protein
MLWKRLIVARTVDAATPIRRAISRIGTPPTNFNPKNFAHLAHDRSLCWHPGLSFGTAKGARPESASRGTCHPGRYHPGMVGDIISERWAELSRNRWAASFRNHGRLAPESAAIAGVEAASQVRCSCPQLQAARRVVIVSPWLLNTPAL